MARDWRMAKASFRGAEFYCDGEQLRAGRRKVIHEYPGSEDYDVEDMGAAAGRFTITAYFLSETSDTEGAAFVAALNQSDAADLIIPIWGLIRCSAQDWSRDWSKERLNYVGIQVTFIDESTGAGAQAPQGLGERIIAGMLASAPSVIGGAVSNLFAGVSVTSYARTDASVFMEDGLALIETVRSSVAISDKVSVKARDAIETLGGEIVDYAMVDVGAWYASALTALDDVVTDSDPSAAAATLVDAAALAINYVPTDDNVVTPPAASCAIALAVATAMEAIRLIATATYTNRQDAIRARAKIASIANPVLPLCGALGPDAADALFDVWGKAADQLSNQIATLAPIVIIETPISMPSTILAYRLYGDPSRGAELVDRNKVGTPMLMPSIFEAPST
jgi:prophage DNA circulation protein